VKWDAVIGCGFERHEEDGWRYDRISQEIGRNVRIAKRFQNSFRLETMLVSHQPVLSKRKIDMHWESFG